MITPSKLITVEEFFGPPVRSRAVLSPDGTKVAYLAPWMGRLNVFVRDLDSDWSTPDDVEGSGARRVTANAQRNINENEEHWFINSESNIELYSRLESFLAKHLGGRSSEAS